MKKPTVCVAMIVKNEAHVIERSLASARRYFDAWVVVDTGSTDETCARVMAETQGWKGTLGRVEWKGFGPARTEALRLAVETGCDYAFILDADEIFSVPDGFAWPTDACDFYNIEMNLSGFVWQQSRLFRLACNWRYEGVLHEFPKSDTAKTVGKLDGVSLNSPRDGARSKDPDKYRNDALALEAAIEADPANARYVFYCAQSWRDAGDTDKSIQWSEKVLTMHGWTEERFLAALRLGMMYGATGEMFLSLDRYLLAMGINPRRAEPYEYLARFYRLREVEGWAHIAYNFAKRGSEVERDLQGFQVDLQCHESRIWDELSIAAFYTGRTKEAIRACKRVISSPYSHPETVFRAVKNLTFMKA